MSMRDLKIMELEDKRRANRVVGKRWQEEKEAEYIMMHRWDVPFSWGAHAADFVLAVMAVGMLTIVIMLLFKLI